MQKVQTVKFSFNKNESEAYAYKCLQVTDSLAFNPGSRYSKEEVEKLCDSERWKVTVVPNS